MSKKPVAGPRIRKAPACGGLGPLEVPSKGVRHLVDESPHGARLPHSLAGAN